MIPGLLAGGGLGFGLWLVIRGIAPAVPSLQRELAEFHRPRPVTRAPGLLGAWAQHWSESLLLHTVADTTRLEADLDVVGTAVERHAIEKVMLAAGGFSVPIVFWLTLAAGGISLPPALLVAVGLSGVTGGFFLPDLMLRSKAAGRRQEFRSALSAYVNVVTIILAGGGGVESALDGAGKASDSWAFLRMREALAQSRMSGESPWAALGRLSTAIRVPELGEISSSIALAGDSGARVRQSLDAKASSMRDRDLSDARARAESQSELMAVPTVVMLGAFVILIAYPAMANILSL